jgi:hypothetical protein
MYKFEYEIKLNELGAPYVELPKNVENLPEHKFMFLELSRLILFNLLKDIEKKQKKGKKTLSPKDTGRIVEAFKVLTELSDEVGLLLKASKEIEDSLDDLLNPDNDKNEEE